MLLNINCQYAMRKASIWTEHLEGLAALTFRCDLLAAEFLRIGRIRRLRRHGVCDSLCPINVMEVDCVYREMSECTAGTREDLLEKSVRLNAIVQ